MSKPIFSPDVIEFMMDIRFNNNKVFMQENKQQYIERLRTPFYQLIDYLGPTMQQIDSNMEIRPNKVLSRIFRDTRFSKSKLPYRDHHWIDFRRKAEPREKAVVFWFEMRIETVSWGLGFWGKNHVAMDMLRQKMLACSQEFLQLLEVINKNNFEIQGDIYKRISIPKEMPTQLKNCYSRKEIYIVKKNVKPSSVFEPGFEKMLANDFLILSPVYHLFRGCYERALIQRQTIKSIKA